MLTVNSNGVTSVPNGSLVYVGAYGSRLEVKNLWDLDGGKTVRSTVLMVFTLQGTEVHRETLKGRVGGVAEEEVYTIKLPNPLVFDQVDYLSPGVFDAEVIL